MYGNLKIYLSVTTVHSEKYQDIPAKSVKVAEYFCRYEDRQKMLDKFVQANRSIDPGIVFAAYTLRDDLVPTAWTEV